MCTLRKLFPAKVGEYCCQGNLWTLQDFLHVSAKTFLRDHHIMASQGKEMNISDVIINKISPDDIEVSKLGLVDICENHRKCLTVKHSSLRQKMCAIKDCTRAGEARRRVSFETSSIIF